MEHGEIHGGIAGAVRSFSASVATIPTAQRNAADALAIGLAASMDFELCNSNPAKAVSKRPLVVARLTALG